jgi:hypothetical protein
MAGKRGTRAEVAARWQERLARWQGQGVSVTDFCDREGVSQQSFFRWRKILSASKSHRRVSRARSAAFIPVEVVSANSEASLHAARAWLEIACGSIICRVTTEIDEQMLRLIVRVLREEINGC